MADVNDPVALASAHFHFVMDLGDQGAHRVNNVGTTLASGFENLGRRPVCRQHDRAPCRYFLDRVDEHDALGLKAINDELVVDDLVVAVDGAREGSDHPGQRLDRHLDAGAEPARFGQ